MKFYQVNRRNTKGELDGFEMVKANSLDEAIKNYLKDDYKDYKLIRNRVNGKLVVAATCEEETSGFLEFMVAEN